MTAKKHNKDKSLKLSNGFSRETAKLRYENLQSDEAEASDEPFEDPVEVKIKAAMAEGDFDNLPGKGKPLDLKAYIETPEHLRTAYHILKNSGYLPEEVRREGFGYETFTLVFSRVEASPDAPDLFAGLR